VLREPLWRRAGCSATTSPSPSRNLASDLNTDADTDPEKPSGIPEGNRCEKKGGHAVRDDLFRVHRELEYLRAAWTVGRRKRKKGQSRAKDRARLRERDQKLKDIGQ
jgi:hypothetical protein